MTPDEEIAVLRAENAQQREQIAVLVARVQELEARLAKDTYTTKTHWVWGVYSVDREGHRE